MTEKPPERIGRLFGVVRGLRRKGKLMSDSYELGEIREHIRKRFETEPRVRLNVSLSRPKLRLEGVEARITGVYRHIFQIEETSTGEKRLHTLQYADVLLGDIEILDEI